MGGPYPRAACLSTCLPVCLAGGQTRLIFQRLEWREAIAFRLLCIYTYIFTGVFVAKHLPADKIQFPHRTCIRHQRIVSVTCLTRSLPSYDISLYLSLSFRSAMQILKKATKHTVNNLLTWRTHKNISPKITV